MSVLKIMYEEYAYTGQDIQKQKMDKQMDRHTVEW